MKHLLSVILLLLVITIAKAQTAKGDQNLGLFLGAGISNGNTSSGSNSPASKQTQHSFSVAPNYSFFLADKLDVGALLLFSTSKQNTVYVDGSGNSINDLSHGFGSSIYLRKYFLFKDKIGIRTGPFIMYQQNNDKANQEQYYYQNAVSSHYSIDNNYKSSFYSGGISMDLVYYPAPKIGLAAALGSLTYSHQTQRTTPNNASETKTSTNQFGLNVTNSLQLSIYYVFGG
jgi:hypothetical protein